MTRRPTIIRVIQTEESITKVYDNGFLESTIHEGAYIDVPYLLEGKKQVEEALPGKKFFVLSQSTGFFRISGEARKLSANKEYAKHIAAVAIVLSHEAIRLIYELFLKINKPPMPTKAFTNRRQARKWLETQMNELQDCRLQDSKLQD